MKNLQNLKGAHQLSKKEQQTINGGNYIGGPCVNDLSCGPNHACCLSEGLCYPSSFVCDPFGGGKGDQ